MKTKIYSLKFIKKEKISTDIYTFYFERPKGLKFLPGQYFKLSLDVDNPDERGTYRYFTLSSSPAEKKYIAITTKIIKSTFKKTLVNIDSGSRINFFGPIGYFNFNHKSPKTKIFLAGGIGITPFRSLIKTFENTKDFKIILLASFSTKEEIIFFEELKEIEKNNSNIKIIYTLTREKVVGFESGRITDELIKKYNKELHVSDYFIVGSEEMEKQLIDVVKKMGVYEKSIFSENFTGY